MNITLNRHLISGVLISMSLQVSMLAHCETSAEVPMKAGSHELAQHLKVGDVVFIRIPHAPFTKVADTTSSWTNHVGIVADITGSEPDIAESRVPFSGITRWSDFIERSESGRVAVARLPIPLNISQKDKLKQAISDRSGILYDTGFDLHSSRQFCSRFVREVLDESTGIKLGEVEDFATLLKRNPDTDLAFWRTWYFGRIPWQRETVTPASLLLDEQIAVYFDGNVIPTCTGKCADQITKINSGSHQ